MRFRDHRDGRRYPRARRRAIATRAPTSSCSTTSPRAPKAAAVDRDWIARVARVLDIPVLRRRRHPQRGRGRAGAATRAPTRSRSTRPRSRIPHLIDAARATLRLAVRRGRHRQPADGRRLSRVYQYTGDPDAHARAGRRTLDWVREAQRARCRRDRAQLHGERRRAPGLRPRAARGRARERAACR